MTLARFFSFFQREAPMFLLVGLGNPGQKYKNNRHNIGFMAMDAIANSYNFPSFKSKFQGQYTEGVIAGCKVGILKPSTFMNESGRSVGLASKFYKLTPDKVIVFHDELDVAASKVKVKIGGGHAGHNGLRSIDAHLGDKNYKRIRMGIDHPGDKNRVSGYVLSDFAKSEQEWLDDVLYGCKKYVELLLDGKDSDFIMRVAETVR